MIGRLERDGYITRGDDKSIAFTDEGRDHAEGSRPPAPPDRALPDRRARHPVGRGPRGGRAARARDVARCSRQRMLAAIGDAKTCPHGHPIDVGQRIEGVPLADVEVGARCASCASRTRPRTCCTTSRPRASSPAWRARWRRATASDVVVAAGGRRCALTALGRRDGLGDRRPVTAAAHGAARAARARQGPLRPLIRRRRPATAPPRRAA